MLINYIKIAWKVLLRHPFYTFITLFGITFTLTILMVITSFLDHLIGNHYPEVYRDRSVYIQRLMLQDTAMQSTRSGPASFNFLNTYTKKLKTAEKVGIFSVFSFANAYINGQRIKLSTKFTDAGFWDVTRFEFLEGKPYSGQNIANGDYVAVITEKTSVDFFGKNASVVGKTIEVDNIRYRVIGVVKGSPVTRPLTHADVYFPYIVSTSNYRSTGLSGNYAAIALAADRSGREAIQREFAGIMSRIALPIREGGQNWAVLTVKAEPYLEGFLSNMFNENTREIFYSIVSLVMLLLMLLPTINLVNLNISRIVERSSEISIRKAFGAPASTLLWQFVIENVFVSLVGGGIAFVLTLGVIRMINSSGWIPYADLTINATVFLASLGLCVVFGLISGVYPAWRMSRMQVAEALRAV